MEAYRELLAHIRPHAASVEVQPDGRFAWSLTVVGVGEFKSTHRFDTAEEAVLEMVDRAKAQGVDAQVDAAEALSSVVEHAELVQKFEKEHRNAAAYADAAVAAEKKRTQRKARIGIFGLLCFAVAGLWVLLR